MRSRRRSTRSWLRTAQVPTLESDFPGPAYVESVATLNRNLGAQPVTPGNRVDLFPGYRDSIAAMTAEVDQATSWVHVEFYITAWDEMTGPFYEALVRAVERGVTVRVLFDHLGSRGIPGYKDFKKRLDTTGIEWHPMLPIQPLKGEWRRPDLRNHRKILVIDGRVAFTGSQNLIEPGYNKPKNHKAGREWVELMAGSQGPAVSALNLVFATDWFSETEVETSTRRARHRPTDRPVTIDCQVIPSGPGFATENNLRAFTTPALLARSDRLSITSPYFVPDESMLYADHHGGASAGSTWSSSSPRSVTSRWSSMRSGPTTGPCSGPAYGSTSTRRRHPALEALQRRRRRRRHRLEQHGHAGGLRCELWQPGRRRRRLRGRQGLVRGERAHRHLRRGGDLTTHRWQGQDRQEARTADRSAAPRGGLGIGLAGGALMALFPAVGLGGALWRVAPVAARSSARWRDTSPEA